MIQFRTDTVWVKEEDGTLLPFDSLRLAESINRAAQLGGTHETSLGESLSAAVEMFALKISPEPVIASADIEQFVVTVLNSIGFTNIASIYNRRSQHVEIHLDDMAARVITGFDLEFYRRLDQALDIVGNKQKTLVQLRGLRRCVLQLRGAQRWSDRCVRLADEIIEHVRTRAARIRPSQGPSLHLTVIQ